MYTLQWIQNKYYKTMRLEVWSLFAEMKIMGYILNHNVDEMKIEYETLKLF